MKLRIVDMAAWINGTNDDPQGVYFHDLPEGWDELDEGQQTEWVQERIGEISPAPERGVGYEFGDFVNDEWQAIAGTAMVMGPAGPTEPTVGNLSVG